MNDTKEIDIQVSSTTLGYKGEGELLMLQ